MNKKAQTIITRSKKCERGVKYPIRKQHAEKSGKTLQTAKLFSAGTEAPKEEACRAVASPRHVSAYNNTSLYSVERGYPP